tara:strand:- start:502 stop:1134 length:633 start_codon:yes stop_codon:yes gene_type:complete
MTSNPSYADAISSIESGGKYDVLGPVTKSGDQAFGKYQIMGANIPQWSKEILGVELTPKQFLSDPAAQDAVFQGKFGQYVDKYGPEGAAQAWIGGPGGVGKLDRKDVLGTTIGDYSRKFMLALGQPPNPQAQNTPQQATQGAPVPGLSNPMLGVGAPPNNAPAASPQPQFSGGGGSMPAQMPAQMAPMQMLGAQIKPRDTYQRLAALFQR